MNQVIFRQASADDAAAVHRLIAANLEVGHLLPRTMDDVVRHAARFTVAEADGRVIACAELAPLSPTVAEVRSLVVDEPARGRHIGPRLVAELATGAVARGFATLCAFTHQPGHFVRLGFTIVPHMWVPEKIAHDCTSCPLFRKCGQYAVTLALRAGVLVRPEQPAAVIYAGRTAAPRKPNVERLQLESSAARQADAPGKQSTGRVEAEGSRAEAVVA
jgi:N-acetylglutamate synthase-like GNAT family acetyltransferase